MELRTAIHEEIQDGSYVCLVCHNEIDSRSHIWSCRSCFRSFDVACVRDWSRRDAARLPKWRCPHCLAPQPQKPAAIRYHCWCGKTTNPGRSGATPDPWAATLAAGAATLPPHSCGQTCGAKRSCPHPCPLVCHAGPHADAAQCMYEGPVIKCFCGKHSEQRLCSESRFGGFSCGSSCGRVHTKCGHACARPCHKAGKPQRGHDACGPCRTTVTVDCYCGRVKMAKRTCGRLPAKTRKDIKTHWPDKLRGQVSCGKPCAGLLACGHHRCDRLCHPPDEASHGACPLQPFAGERCFCGKVAAHRQACTDPKVRCDSPCGKMLACGHACAQRCHDGPCPPCERLLTDVPCRCRRTVQTATCHASRTSPPECDRPCGAQLSCRRHECRRLCCEFAPRGKSHPGQGRARRGRTLTLDELLLNGDTSLRTSDEPVSEAEEAAHLCVRVCGKTLGCGTHTCVQPCHAGACPPCLAASFDEWACPCGRTRIEPPIRCGTVMPQCRLSCHRPQPCGHAAAHECHPEGIACPPCEKFVSVPCRCQKSKVSVRCSQRDTDTPPQCMESCGRTLECGHVCMKRCCEGEAACMPCESLCRKKYESCGHEHHARCHYPEECAEQCSQSLTASCPCGVLKLPYVCGEDVEVGCNDVCVREAYPLLLLDAYEEDKAWCTNIEIQLRAFVLQKSGSRTHWFKPMNRKRRRFVYYLLEHYGLEGQSMDEGANRSICAYRTSSTWLPKVRLSQARRKRPEVDIVLTDVEGETETVNENENMSHVGSEAPEDNNEAWTVISDGDANIPDMGASLEVSNFALADDGAHGNSDSCVEEGWIRAPGSERSSPAGAEAESSDASSYSKLSRSFSVLSME